MQSAQKLFQYYVCVLVRLSVCLSVCAGKLEEVKDCDCEGGLTVHADVLAQDGLLWEQ